MPKTRPNRAGSPGRPFSVRPLARAGLLALAALAVAGQGCASLGLGNGCGNGCGPTAFSGIRNRLATCNLREKLSFHRRPAVAVDACDPTLGSFPVESGEGAFLPSGPMLQSTPIQGPIDANPNLEPLPDEPNSLTAPTGAKAGTVNKSLYQTRANAPRGEALQAPPRGAAGVQPAGRPAATLPGDRRRPPPPPRPRRSTWPPPPCPPPNTASVGPGIRRFQPIEPRLAVGSLPIEAGWMWLSELGYRTVIDLRDASEVTAAEVARDRPPGAPPRLDPLGARRDRPGRAGEAPNRVAEGGRPTRLPVRRRRQPRRIGRVPLPRHDAKIGDRGRPARGRRGRRDRLTSLEVGPRLRREDPGCDPRPREARRHREPAPPARRRLPLLRPPRSDRDPSMSCHPRPSDGQSLGNGEWTSTRSRRVG